MGKTIERIARERGHEIVSIIDIDNRNDFNSEAFKSADAAIEFTAPQVALENYKAAWNAGIYRRLKLKLRKTIIRYFGRPTLVWESMFSWL